MGFLCNIWSTTAIQWSKYNLTWSECQFIQDIIVNPGVWSTTAIQWSKYNLTWSGCQFIQDIIVNPGGVDAEMLIQPWNPYQTGSLDKRKKLIKLICKINGREYPQEREVKNFKITIGDIKTMIKTVTDVDLDFKWRNKCIKYTQTNPKTSNAKFMSKMLHLRTQRLALL